MQITRRRLFLAACILSKLHLVVADVLRDSLCFVSLLPCVADCFMLYTELTYAERFVLTIIKKKIIITYYRKLRNAAKVDDEND